MPGIGLLRRLRIRLSPVDRAAVTMNRGRGAGSILPFLLDPSDPTSAGIDNQDNCFIGTRLFTFPLLPTRGSRPAPGKACAIATEATAASGSEMPSLLSLGPPLNSPNLDLTVKTIAFIGTRLFTFPLVPMKGSRPVFSALGLSTTDAITLFYKQVVIRHRLPFDTRIPNSGTLEAIAHARTSEELAEFERSDELTSESA